MNREKFGKKFNVMIFEGGPDQIITLVIEYNNIDIWTCDYSNREIAENTAVTMIDNLCGLYYRPEEHILENINSISSRYLKWLVLLRPEYKGVKLWLELNK